MTARTNCVLILRMKNVIVVLVFTIAGLGVGCGSHHSYSGPVGVNLRAQSGDVTGGTITDDKLITSETGNPYGTFLNDARVSLGRDPSNVEVSALTLFLGAQSTGVTALEQVFTGQVDVLFLIPSTGNSFNVGHVVSPTGAGPINLTVDFDSSQLVGQNHFALMSGSFRVFIRGAAAAGFASRNADAILQNAFTFKAVE